jgi:hypothetical protein
MTSNRSRPLAGALVVGALVASVASLAAARVLTDERDTALAPQRAPTPVALDLSTNEGTDAAFLRGVRVSALNASVPPDGIRAIDDPVFDTPDEASTLLLDTDLVVGFVHDGDARAYPVGLLSLHEVVNDVVGGKPVAITWCPLCQSAAVVEREIGGETIELGVSGYLLHSNQVLFDRRTGSLWSQIAGGAITGAMRGASFVVLPAVVETWVAWREDHPGTRVLSIREDVFAGRFERPFEIRTPRGPELSSEPYGPYLAKVPTYNPRTVDGVPDAEPILGVTVGRYAKAYPRATLLAGPVNDVVHGTPVLVVRDAGADSHRAFVREADGVTLTFAEREGAVLDEQTATRWSPRTGEALDGPLAGTRLTPLGAVTAYWFAWRRLRPDALVYRGN